MKRYHLIGIGGIGMSALARLLLARGDKVQGSDLKQSPIIDQLREWGAEIFIGHAQHHLKKVDVVVYSSDIPTTNVEYIGAQAQGLCLWHRSDLLSFLLKGFAPLLVTGTHGKTTTSALLAHTLVDAGLDPSYAVGGVLQNYQTNSHAGKGVYFVAEADESDGSFLKYPSFGAIITNIEQDHMNYWKTEERLIDGFSTFARKIGSKEHLFWCADDPRLSALKLRGYSYGFSEKADILIENFQQHPGKTVFDLWACSIRYQDIEIPLIGAHNVLNAAAVFGLCLKLDLSQEKIRQGFATFRGVGRRVEKKGSIKDIDIYDDYAHHPTEIFATLRALKTTHHGRRIVVAFQPHRYTRTQHCMEEFAEAFKYADQIVLTDIYSANETPIESISAEHLLKKVVDAGFTQAQLIKRADLSIFLSHILKPGDLLVTMGAGDITTVGPDVLIKLKEQWGE